MNARTSLEESIGIKGKLLEDALFWAAFENVVQAVSDRLLNKNKLLIAGNGGSASDAQHFAAEIVATLEKETRRGYPALALNGNTSFLTAWLNDYGPDEIFSRQVEAFGKEGDIFFGISTSGNSKNIILAAEKAKSKGIFVVGLLGNEGGALKDKCDISLIVPSANTARVQEVHIWMIHAICKEVVPLLE